MGGLLAAILGFSVLMAPMKEWAGPRAIHYPMEWMGRRATANHLDWRRTFRNGQAKYIVNGKLYDGMASTPLCPSDKVGGIVTATFLNRFTGEWQRETYITADVSQPYDRDAQIQGQRLVELNYEAQAAHGYTIDQGWGWGPVKNISVRCP